MNDQPHKSSSPAGSKFGKRGAGAGGRVPPPGAEANARVMRSAVICLVLMGGGGLAFCSKPIDERCRQEHPDRPQDCQSSSGRSSGSSRSWWSSGHSSFSFSDSGTSSAASGSQSHAVTRGGFGGAAHAFGGHSGG